MVVTLGTMKAYATSDQMMWAMAHGRPCVQACHFVKNVATRDDLPLDSMLRSRCLLQLSYCAAA